MQQSTQQLLKIAVQESNHSAYGLSAQIVQLDVVQSAVAHLIERIDDIVHKGWDKDPGMARLAISEIRDTVRLIDMGFYPLFKSMSKEIKAVNVHADTIFDILIKGELEQVTHNTTGKIDANTPEGWNYLAMEHNIKTFIKEFGREPESFEEVSIYIKQIVTKVVDANEENKKADALTSTNEMNM